MTFSSRPLIMAGLGVIGATAALVTASPASAAAPACPYPYVCFYNVDDLNHPAAKMTGKYQVVTSGWQWFTGSSYGADLVVNTRNDDVAYVHMSNGTVICVENNSRHSFINDEPLRYADGVRISSAANC
ncbi:hypothetical protein M5362_10915 [Streptomyces sp. Je 1-79]|uniref:hypothetical protein n=1 Tax=Streptomyces sp. Je 1-79 TaxID=2943847 RepID=UPI0021A69492|nr:hypothetical protein [Streptomyces sp. Je 1-79]MCT4353639.1 hypothetical protein [Streptomyces sp. Je 1-79]